MKAKTREAQTRGSRPRLMSARSAAAIAGALLWTVGCKDKHQLATPPPPLVEVAMATQADVPIYHEWIGVLDGLVNAQIRAQVTGGLTRYCVAAASPLYYWRGGRPHRIAASGGGSFTFF